MRFYLISDYFDTEDYTINYSLKEIKNPNFVLWYLAHIKALDLKTAKIDLNVEYIKVKDYSYNLFKGTKNKYLRKCVSK
jgi:hypothetical protein